MFTDTEEMVPPEDSEDASLPFSTPYGIHHAMSELMALGVTLPQVVAMATSNAAKMLRMEDHIGALKPGMDADISVFRVLTGRMDVARFERRRSGRASSCCIRKAWCAPVR